jgi:hypothetical protein
LKLGAGSMTELAWKPPSCPLRYQLFSLHGAEVAPGRPPTGIEMLAELSLSPAAEGFSLQLVEASKALLHDDERQDTTVDVASWVPTALSSDGRKLSELAGPTTLWASTTALPAVSVFFPLLPQRVHVGSKAKWVIASYKQHATAEVERQRAADAAVAPPMPEQIAADVMVADWISVGEGEQREVAAILEGSWALDTHEVEPIETKRKERWFGRFVITASGRLLYAGMVANKWQWWSQADEKAGEKPGFAEQELRLVEACDGASLPRRAPTQKL